MAAKKTSKKASVKKEVAKKEVAKKSPDKKETENKISDHIEGMTKATEESKVISFREGSGSNDLLNLIIKYGFEREKVLAEAEKLKKAGKAFEKSDPAKKYNKVAGIIKTLQNQGFKLPKVA